MKPIVTRTSEPVRLISDGEIAEYVGYDPDRDLSQDRVWPILYRAAIERGEHITGAVWAMAEYSIDRLPLSGCGRYFGVGAVVMPITPVFAVSEFYAVDADGTETLLPQSSWSLIPASPEFYRPWGIINAVGRPFPYASWFKAMVTAGWTAESFPDSLRAWALTRMATLYDYREDLVTGTITANLPRDHTVSLLDRWRVYGNPYV